MYEQITSNKVKSIALIAVFVLIATGVGYVLGLALSVRFSGNGSFGIPFLFIFGVMSILFSVFTYFKGDSVVLAMSQAKEVSPEQEPKLHNLLEELALGLGLPKPRVFVIEDPAPNAFATGRDPAHASVAVTRGLLEMMNRTELEGVLAHEMSHIKNYDTRLLAVASLLVGLIALMSDFFLRSTFFWGSGRRDDRGGGGSFQLVLMAVALVLAILAPISATLLQLALSRQREYLADASGAMLTRYPQGLASALRKIASDPNALHVANKATAALYIENPLREHGGFLNGIFDTHPPVEERIRRLEQMSGAPSAGI